MNDQPATTAPSPAAAPQAAPAAPALLTPEQLVERWQGAVSVATLAEWRRRGRRKGPAFTKLGRDVRYPLDAVLAYEAQQVRGGS